MIRVIKPSVATSVQDRGRVGHRAEGFSTSGAMDVPSLDATNTLAGAPVGSAGIEFGPGRCVLDIEGNTTIAFGGARREGAPWWETIEVAAPTTFELSGPGDGVWSYLAIAGGIDLPMVRGSRSAAVREGIGAWIAQGDKLLALQERVPPAPAQPLPMSGETRIYGELPGDWRVGRRADRMGYQLEGPALPVGIPSEWSEPLLPGFTQLLPSGLPIILMAEGPTVGGYPVAAVVRSEDLRFVAQTPIGGLLRFRTVGDLS